MAIMLKPEWFQEFVSKVGANSEFVEGMKKWEGEVSIGLKPSPEIGLDKELYYKIDPSGGAVKGMGYCNKGEAERAKACILVDYLTFKDLAAGKIDMGKLIMSRKASIKGDMMYAMKFLKPITAMVSLLKDVGGGFPDALKGGELEDFKKWTKETQAKVGA